MKSGRGMQKHYERKQARKKQAHQREKDDFEKMIKDMSELQESAPASFGWYGYLAWLDKNNLCARRRGKGERDGTSVML